MSSEKIGKRIFCFLDSKRTVSQISLFRITNTYLRCALVPLIALWLVFKQALILAFYYSKNKQKHFFQTTLKRDLWCALLTFIPLRPFLMVRPISQFMHRRTWLNTESLFWQRKGQGTPLRLPPTGTSYNEWTIRTDICVFHNSW